jgi:hypothetical protein
MAYKGRFVPKNPKKYKGDPTNVIYRSLWERQVMKYLDLNSTVLEWASEEIVVPYRSAVDGRMHRYFVDFYAKIQTGNEITTYLLEVKPERQTLPPVKKKKASRRYINEMKTYAVNVSKWEAAIDFCEERGWKFMILTEKNLNVSK